MKYPKSMQENLKVILTCIFNLLIEYFVNKMRFKKMKRISFRRIGNEHVEELRKIMKKQKTRN